MLGNPISHIESPIVRNFCKYGIVYGRKFFTNCLLELVKIVECNIAKEMKHVRGALMYGGWKRHGTHYIAAFALYNRKISARSNGIETTNNSVVSTLITFRPMSQIENTDCNENETSKFNAEVHIHHFRTVFNFFELDLDNWMIC